MSNDIDFGAMIGPVARELWGEPNRAQQTKRHELRFGTHGSKSVDLHKGVWRDHEANEGGGVLDLIRRELNLVDGDALKWLREKRFLNGHDASSLGEPVATYPYVDEAGELLFQVCRYSPKTFRQRRPNGSGKWEYSLNGVRRVLYKLPVIAQALMKNLPIAIVEGEKDVDALVQLGISATTNPGGAGKWHSSYNEYLRDADVILVPDNDQAGQEHMQAVAGALQGVAKSIRILTLPQLPEKGDTSDWLSNGGTIEQLRALIDAAPQYQRAPAAPLNFQWHRDVNNPTRKELVKNLLPETGCGLLSGQSGTYKTFCAINLAAAVATRKPFAGYAIKRPGATFAFVSEGSSGWQQRLDAAAKHDHDNARLPICFTGEPMDLLEPASVARAIDYVKAAAVSAKRDLDLPLALVIFDTVIGAAGFKKSGDENDSTVAARLMAALAAISAQTGAFVLGVDHFGKAVETGTRGSSAKEAAADVVLALIANKSIAGEVSGQRLAVRKRRDGPAGIEHAFTIVPVELGVDEDDEPIRSCVVEFSATPLAPTAPKEDDGWTKSLVTLKRIMMTLLVDCGEDMLPWADYPGGMVRGIKADIVRAEYFKQHPADGAKDKDGAKRRAWNRVVQSAQAKTLIGFREVTGTEYMWFIKPVS